MIVQHTPTLLLKIQGTREVKAMRRALIAMLLAGAVAVSTTKPAEARWGWGWGWGLGAFAIGALIGAALWRPAYSYYYPAYGYPAYGYGYGYGYPGYTSGYAYPSYYYGGYSRPYYGGYYGGYYGYRIARRSSSVMLAGAKKNSAITWAGAKIRRVHGVASLASSTATSSRTHPPKRVQGRFATGGSTARTVWVTAE
jgi:hypothetical protein